MPIRILHVVTYMGRGGLESMLMNYYRHMDRNKVQFDFLVHRDLRLTMMRRFFLLGGKSIISPGWFHGVKLTGKN